MKQINKYLEKQSIASINLILLPITRFISRIFKAIIDTFHYCRYSLKKLSLYLESKVKWVRIIVKKTKIRDYMFILLMFSIIYFSALNLSKDYSNYTKMNVGNSITLIIGCFFSYFFTQQKMDVRVLISSQEKALDLIVDVCNDIFTKFRDEKARDEVHIKLKSCDLKIVFIGSFQKKLKISQEYNELLNTFNRFNELVSLTSDQDVEFTNDIRTEILSLLLDINSKCTNIKSKLILI